MENDSLNIEDDEDYWLHYRKKSLEIRKPQLDFEDRIDNSASPFIHRISTKPNGLQPLPSHPITENPYKYEIEHFKYLEWQFQPPYRYDLLNEVPY